MATGWVYRRPHDSQLQRAREWPAPLPPPALPDQPWDEPLEFVDDDWDAHDGSTDPVHFARDEVPPYYPDPEPADDDALCPAVESYQQRDHDFLVWDAIPEAPEDDEQPHDGSTDPVHLPGVAAVAPDQPWDVLLDADDDPALEAQPGGYQQRDHDIPQPWEGSDTFGGDDEVAHDGSTDPVHFPGTAAAAQPDQPWDEQLDVAEDYALTAIADGYQQSDNVPAAALPESAAAPDVWDEDSDDLEILDDYDNTGPDEAFEESPLLVDDEPAAPDGGTDPVHLPGAVTLPDQPWDELLDLVDGLEPIEAALDDYQQREHDVQPQDGIDTFAEDDESPSDGSTDPVHFARDENPSQSIADEPDTDDDTPQDGSTDPVHFPGATVIQPDQPWDEPLEADDDPELPHDGSTDALQREHDVQPWDGEPATPDDDDLPHDGSTDAIQEIVVAPDRPWDEAQQADDDDELPHDGSTDAIQREHDVQPQDGEPTAPEDDDLPHDGSTDPVHFARDEQPPQSFDAEFDADDDAPHEGSTDAIVEFVPSPEQPQDGVDTFVDDDDLPHDGSTGPVPDQNRDEDIPQSFADDSVFDDLEADELPHDGSTDPVSTDPGQPEPPAPPEHPGHGGGPDGPPRRPPRPGIRPDEEYLDDEIIYIVIALVMAGVI